MPIATASLSVKLVVMRSGVPVETRPRFGFCSRPPAERRLNSFLALKISPPSCLTDVTLRIPPK
jgi:hypothetical protein